MVESDEGRCVAEGVMAGSEPLCWRGHAEGGGDRDSGGGRVSVGCCAKGALCMGHPGC